MGFLIFFMMQSTLTSTFERRMSTFERRTSTFELRTSTFSHPFGRFRTLSDGFRTFSDVFRTFSNVCRTFSGRFRMSSDDFHEKNVFFTKHHRFLALSIAKQIVLFININFVFFVSKSLPNEICCKQFT